MKQKRQKYYLNCKGRKYPAKIVTLLLLLVLSGCAFGEGFQQGRAIANVEDGVAYHEAGEFDRAIAEYSRAIELDPEHAPAYASRAWAYFDKGLPKPALADAKKAVELDPMYANAYHARGAAYLLNSQLDLALDDFNKAIELEPGNSRIYLNRGAVQWRMGFKEEALTDYHTAIDLSGESNDREYIVRSLQSFVPTLRDQHSVARNESEIKQIEDLLQKIEVDP